MPTGTHNPSDAGPADPLMADVTEVIDLSKVLRNVAALLLLLAVLKLLVVALAATQVVPVPLNLRPLAVVNLLIGLGAMLCWSVTQLRAARALKCVNEASMTPDAMNAAFERLRGHIVSVTIIVPIICLFHLAIDLTAIFP